MPKGAAAGPSRRRLRFGLRSLLLTPVAIATILLCVFPKLLTGDYAEVTVADLQVGEGFILIGMDVSYSAGTGLRVSVPGGGAFTGCTLSGGGESVLPTWPKHGRVEVRLGGARQSDAAVA